jgi:hypothetical protein
MRANCRYSLKMIFFVGAQLQAISILGVPVSMIIHELGHVLAAKILFRNSNPTITFNISGFDGGQTNVNLNVLSPVGEILGKKVSKAIVTAAGPMTELVALIGLVALTGNSDIVAVPLLNLAGYSLNKDPRRDFQKIRKSFPMVGHVFSAATFLATTGIVANQSKFFGSVMSFI